MDGGDFILLGTYAILGLMWAWLWKERGKHMYLKGRVDTYLEIERMLNERAERGAADLPVTRGTVVAMMERHEIFMEVADRLNAAIPEFANLYTLTPS
jgi:hypothetical protein